MEERTQSRHYAALDSSGPELCAALSVVAATTEDTPLAFYCKAGKDRTGLVAALSLHCCGAGMKVHVSLAPRSFVRRLLLLGAA